MATTGKPAVTLQRETKEELGFSRQAPVRWFAPTLGFQSHKGFVRLRLSSDGSLTVYPSG
jgi:8-oxo-dGTP pyrophosphatase MutT (NUDIX family)